MTRDGNYYNRRWLRPTAQMRAVLLRDGNMRFHLGEPSLHYSQHPAIWAYCGLGITGDSPGDDTFELCPTDCDESRHCKQCAKSLARRIAGRSA